MSTNQSSASEISQNKDGEQSKSKAKRNQYDQERDKKIYEYLLTLTDYDPTIPNENRIAEQWGMTGNRMFVSRVIKSTLPQTESKNSLEESEPRNSPESSENLSGVPGITLNKLVEILKNLEKYRQKNSKHQTGEKFPKILTRSEKLRALSLYTNISSDERKSLNLKDDETQRLLQNLIEDITDTHNGLSSGKINEVCKYISTCFDQDIEKENHNKDYDIKSIIDNSIERVGFEYFEHLKQDSLDELKERISRRIQNAIEDIKYQNGSYTFDSFLDRDIKRNNKINIRKAKELELQRQGIEIRFSPQKFIKRLTKSIIENEVLTEEFPVHMKHIEIQEIQQSIPQNQDENSRDHLYAYTVKVHFYLKDSEDKRVDFYEEVTGVGSPLSHTIAAMNRALLWDIKSLNQYIPIAKQITFNTEIIGSSNNGSIWGHYVVGLCKRANIDEQEDSYHVEELASGDYCGFDTLEVYAKASFYARLRAIKKTGVSSSIYIKELQKKIKQVEVLRNGEKMLNEYPFSLEAMKSYLTKNLLSKCYDLDGNSCPTAALLKTNSNWSLTEYEAHLSIAESYLKEGLYAIGKNYLDCIESHMKRTGSNLISKVIIAKYHLCYFRYHYLTDLDYENEENPNRDTAVNNAISHLDEAYQNLQEYVYKCNKIDELPHINFYNFYTVMSKLYAHRGKLCFFMSSHLPNNNNDSILDSNSTELFQEARVYAARSGNSSLYSMWSAYQSWCLLVDAYTQLSGKEEYIDKAQKILVHALQSYEKIGKNHYESIKLRSGKENKVLSSKNNSRKNEIGYEDHGEIKIQGIPFVREFVKCENDKSSVEYSASDGRLTFDMSSLTSDLTNPPTLLFGTQSSILIFALAMLKLCHYEYNDSEISTEVESARKMFSYAWSFAEDGVHQMKNNKIDRWSDKTKKDVNNIEFPRSLDEALESRHLSGLYPHRLTQFADFGKIYFIACELILLSQTSQENDRWAYIDQLLGTILINHLGARATQTTQTRYNGHLQEHFAAIEKYVRDFRKIEKKISIRKVRDAVVKDIAKILRTGHIQVPMAGL
jgi:hypothetical protein